MPLPTNTRWRECFVATGLFVVWMLLAGRLVQLHVSNGKEFEKLAARQRVFREVVPARPGEIVDRYGHVFATSVPVRSLYVVPQRVRDGWHLSQQLADVLGIDADKLFERIAAHRGRQFLWIKRRISDEETERIRQLKLPGDAWGFRDEFRRLYPQAGTAAQVIGLRDIDGVGRGGIEQSLDALVRGDDGARELVQDARGKVIEIRESGGTPVRHGQTVVLTLDAVIQVFAERSLDQVMAEWKPKSACAVVLDPQSGEVLAMASRPTFDPNQPENVPAEAWKCRPIADIYEPGSTFKPFVVAKALERGCIVRDEIFDCENGEYRMGRRVLHDHHRYGRLSVADILVKSSNIGMAKIGLRLTNAGLHQAALAFGFGGTTGIELPGELSGMVRPLRKWNSYSTGSVPMGQEIAATPLQIITAYAALCNGGRLSSPHLVKMSDDANGETTGGLTAAARSFEASPSVAPPKSEIRNPKSKIPPSLVVSQAISPEIADWVRREALTAVITRGTGKKGAIAGYVVFGKSGTAQKADPATGEYSHELHVSSFLCGAPADDPRVLVMISVDEPSISLNGEHFGGSIAAPAAGELLRKSLLRLQIPPGDKPAQTAGLPEADVVE
jgi:cell division protein FtsI/penicillin-binding protein 2